MTARLCLILALVAAAGTSGAAQDGQQGGAVPAGPGAPAGAMDLLFNQARRLFDGFDYEQAVSVFDQILGDLAGAAANLNLAIVHMRLGNWTEAQAALGRVTLPDGAGVSAGTTAYLLGLCPEALERPSEAEAAFTSAAAADQARLWSSGPLISPLARAKLARP